ncbi:MAG TPA: VOC family protein [Halioglobus sp.]
MMQRFRVFVLVLFTFGSTVVLAQAQGSYLPGKFVRADLVTNDLPAASAFYGSLFGWQYDTYPGRAVILGDDREMGAIFQRDLPPDEIRKPRWVAYMSVPDVDAAQQIVTANGGGTLLAPRAVPDLGTLAVFNDDQGAVFGAIHLNAGDPEDYLAEPGEWIWIALTSRDATKSGDFYRQLAPYELFDNTLSERDGSYVLASEGYARAGLMTIPATRREVQPSWLPFVRVESIVEATATAQRLGGKVLVSPRQALADGKVAVIADPTGAAIGILEWQFETAPTEQLP